MKAQVDKRCYTAIIHSFCWSKAYASNAEQDARGRVAISAPV